MLGTFGLRPKGTLRARALGMARGLQPGGWRFQLITTPWDAPEDAGSRWVEDGVPIQNTRVTRPALWPWPVVEMVRSTRAAGPNLIHLFKPKGFGDLAGRWLRRSTPVVVDMDDWEGDGGWNDIAGYSHVQRRVFDWQERTWPRQADAITVASRELERRALALGACRERVFFVPNGLTRARFESLSPDPLGARKFRQEHQLGSAPAILLYTRFVEFDPTSIARFLALVRRHNSDARLIIAGGSPDGVAERRLAGEAARAGVADAIVRLGWISPAQLPAIATACEVALHPFDDTLVNRAKSSVKLLELMACAIPVVTTDVGENGTFVEHEESGLLCHPGGPEVLAVAAQALLQQVDLRARMGAAARRRVAEHFLWEQLARRVQQAYEMARERGLRVA